MPRRQKSQRGQQVSQHSGASSSIPTSNDNTSKPSSQQGQMDSNTWETEKLKHNLDIEAIPFNSRLSSLLPGYIPTLAVLKEAASELAFVAFDTESVPDCYKTADVGLAFLPEIDGTISAGSEAPTLDKFVQRHWVQAASFKVNGRYHDICNKSDPTQPPSPGVAGVVPREPLRFGRERFVDIEDLETAITNQVNQFRRKVPGKQLILVGLSLQNDLERLCLEFPGISKAFSGWVDLSTLMKAESITPPNVEIGLESALLAFRYPYEDAGFEETHQASNDAVRTLAALCSLVDPQNLKDLVIRQYHFTGIEVAPSINHFESKTYRALIHTGGSNLPPPIDSAQKLAFAFQDFHPIGVAADCSNSKQKKKQLYPASIHASHRTCGCICFNNNKTLQEFIKAKNGARYGDLILQVDRAPLPKSIQKQISRGRKLSADRTSRRKEADLDVDWTDSFQVTFVIESDEEDEDMATLHGGQSHATSSRAGDKRGKSVERRVPSEHTVEIRTVGTSTIPDDSRQTDASSRHGFVEELDEPNYVTHTEPEKRVSRLSSFMGKIRRRMSIRRRHAPNEAVVTAGPD